MNRYFAVFLAAALSLPGAAQVRLVQKADRISVTVDGQPFTELFVSGENVHKPYFHPLRSASGKIVTRLYPMKTVEGESHDHPHHRGLWFAHGNVNGTDFWSSDPSRQGDQYGRIVLNKVLELKNGAKQGLLHALFDWRDSRGNTLVREDRRVVFYSHPTLRIMDFDLRLTGVEKARFGDTKEGTFAIRVASSLNERHGGTIENAEGATGEKSCWGKRSNWVDYHGEVGGEKVGIAIFDHPANPRHPTYWHVRGYGLFAANIFGEHDFYRDKTRDGSMTLMPGQSWRFRYRVVIHPGDANSAGIAKMYQEYARTK